MFTKLAGTHLWQHKVSEVADLCKRTSKRTDPSLVGSPFGYPGQVDCEAVMFLLNRNYEGL